MKIPKLMLSKRRPPFMGHFTLLAFLSLGPNSPAANVFWDGGSADITDPGNGASAGGAGTWNTSLLNWDAGAGPHVAWNNAANDTAVFAGTAGAIDVAEPITAGGLTFLANGFTFSNNPVQLSSGAVVKGANTNYNLAGLALADGNTTWRFASSSTSTGAFANGNVFRISQALTGDVSVVVSGTQPFYFTAATGLNYTGTTTVEPGAALGFDTVDISGLTVGSVAMGANSHFLRRGANLNNATLQLLAPTQETFAIYGNNGGSANPLDLSGLNGGTDLPNASLAFWDNVGTRTFAFTGTITPGRNGYRFGGSKAANIINLTIANSLTGSHALTLVPGSISRLRLHTSNDFTGDTTIHASTVFLLNSLALQNSAINTAGAGKLDVSGNREGLSPSTNSPVTTLTLGGLKGGVDINQVFNASYTTAGGGVTALTLNPGSGATHTYSGAISNGAPGMALIKSGDGTQVLSGANTYTGPTTVTTGTLAFGGGSMASAITVNEGASLGFTLEAPTVSTGSVAFEPNTYIKILGTPTLPSYMLLTTTEVLGMEPTLDPAVPGYELKITDGNTLMLVAASGSPYATWASGAGFYNDANGDGLNNGIAWMLGAETPTNLGSAILPNPQLSGDFLTLQFKRVSNRGLAKLYLDYGSALVGWTSLEIPNVGGMVGAGIVVQVDTGSPTDNILVKIPTALAVPFGRLFARLRATEN